MCVELKQGCSCLARHLKQCDVLEIRVEAEERPRVDVLKLSGKSEDSRGSALEGGVVTGDRGISDI